MYLKNLKSLLLIISFIFSQQLFAEVQRSVTEAYFSPRQGKEVFKKIYKLVRNSEKYVYISIYSWSDKGIDDAMIQAEKNGADVKVVLHPDLYKDKKTVQAKVKTLEENGVEVKIAKMKMHEKMVIIDDKVVINSSANFSSGPKSRYSENWIFHYNDKINN